MPCDMQMKNQAGGASKSNSNRLNSSYHFYRTCISTMIVCNTLCVTYVIEVHTCKLLGMLCYDEDMRKLYGIIMALIDSTIYAHQFTRPLIIA